jgi:hypothetical protein
LEAATEAVCRSGHYQIEPALRGISAEGIKRWTLVSAFGTADAMVLVDLDDFTADAGCDLA